MEEIKNIQSAYEEPKIEFIHLTETDIITTSGDSYDGPDDEGEMVTGNS